MDMTYAKLVHLLDHNPSLVEPVHFYRVLRRSIAHHLVESCPDVSPVYRSVIRHLARQLAQHPEQHERVKDSLHYAALWAIFDSDPSCEALLGLLNWFADFDAKIQLERPA